eukprot:1399608-Pleurochrysis_carterae.AAC.1
MMPDSSGSKLFASSILRLKTAASSSPPPPAAAIACWFARSCAQRRSSGGAPAACARVAASCSNRSCRSAWRAATGAPIVARRASAVSSRALTRCFSCALS